ncbi:MAG: hypothetical protein F6J93_00390 [Oscillatoria sp. SIO1A7]|nr:hypothetical protein [Oscillatoria sp. SIO1A7]
MYCLQLSNRKRNKPQLLLTLLALATTLAGPTGCISQSEKPDPPPEERNPEPVKLPSQSLPVPGWLGFGTIAEKDSPRKFPWSPINSLGQVAIPHQDWSEVEEGTPLVAIGPGFKQEVRFLRWTEEPYGCNETPTPMATFTSSTPVPEGPIWLLPPAGTIATANAATANAATANTATVNTAMVNTAMVNTAMVNTATANTAMVNTAIANNTVGIPLKELSLDAVPESLLPKQKREPTKALAWKAGKTIILLEKKNKDKAQLTVAVNSEKVFSTEAEHSVMEGVYHEPVDFSIPFQPGIPKPVGVFQFGEDSMPTIVLWRPSFEGNHFELLMQTSEGMQPVDVHYIYFCAF